MNGSPRPPTYVFCVPRPGRLAFLTTNKVKPIFICLFQTQDMPSLSNAKLAYRAHWMLYYVNFFFCVLHHAHGETRCMSKSKLKVNVKGAVRCSYVQRCSRAKYVSQSPRCGEARLSVHCWRPFPLKFECMFKSKISCILGNSQFWAFYVHFEDG